MCFRISALVFRWPKQNANSDTSGLFLLGGGPLERRLGICRAQIKLYTPKSSPGTPPEGWSREILSENAKKKRNGMKKRREASGDIRQQHKHEHRNKRTNKSVLDQFRMEKTVDIWVLPFGHLKMFQKPGKAFACM